MPRTDRASRVIGASPHRVYAALVNAEELTTWLPPRGMSARFERFDPRPGGSYRLVLSYPDGGEGTGKATADSDIVEARFLDLEPDVRVVQAVHFESDDPAFGGTMTMTWELTQVDGGTTVDITAENVPDGISGEDHTTGMTSSLANSPPTSTGEWGYLFRPTTAGASARHAARRRSHPWAPPRTWTHTWSAPASKWSCTRAAMAASSPHATT